MRSAFVFLLCFSIALSAGENKRVAFENPIKSVFGKEAPLTSHYPVASKVNVVTGEYYEEECDLVVAGSQPVTLRRFYGHFGPYHRAYNFWRFNPEHFCAANFEWQEQPTFAAAGQADGRVCCYDIKSSGFFTFNPAKQPSFTHANLNGQKHPLNSRITYRKIEQKILQDKRDSQTKEFFRWQGEIQEGDGTKKLFCSDFRPWLSSMRDISIGYDDEDDYKHPYRSPPQISPDFWTPYQVPVYEERKPNGNILCYTYESYDYGGYSPDYLLSSITAYNATKSKILGFIKFKYRKEGKYDICAVEVTGSDNRQATFAYDRKHVENNVIWYLASVTTPNQPPISYRHHKDFHPSKHRKVHPAEEKCIESVSRPDGRVLSTDYCKDILRVTAQHAPIGSNGEICPVARYNHAYKENKTEVLDAENNKTTYRYDANNRIIAVEIYEKEKIYRIDKYIWDPNTGNLLKKTTEDAFGKIVFIETYQYDQNQNVIVEAIGDGKEFYQIYRTYSNDGFNLKLSEKDDFGKHILYSYVPGTNLLSSEFTLENQKIRKRVFHFYDDCAICIKTIIDDGEKENPYDLTSVTFRKIQTVKPRYELPCFGLPEVVEEKTIDPAGNEILLSKTLYFYTAFGKISKEEHYDSQNVYRFSIHNTYDDRERLVSTTDAMGQKMTFSYDANNNLLSATAPQGKYKKWNYDKANRPIAETDDLNLTQLRRYDKLSRIIASIDESGFETTYDYDSLGRVTAIHHPDRTVEKKTYDVLGNLIKEIDAKGYETKKTYHFSRQVASIFYPDGSQEFFTYRPDGKLLSTIDKSGATHLFTYDPLGNPVSEKILASSGEVLKKKEATFSCFCKLSNTDPEGIITTYTYDFAGRKTSEKLASKTTYFSYDTLGRLTKTQIGDTIYCTEYDLVNRPIEKRIEDLSTRLYQKENYAYDQWGNKTHVITSKGTSETLYNSRGEPIQYKDPLGHLTTFSYHYTHGLTKTITTPKGTQKVQIFDSRKREIETYTKNIHGEIIQKTTRRFDEIGNPIETTEHLFEGTLFKKTITHTRTYGPCHQLTSLLEAGQKKTAYFYDEKGRLKTLLKPDNTSLEHIYDELGRLTRYYSSDFDYHYTYDRCDRPLLVTDTFTSTTTQRNYDAFGNVTQETLANGLTLSHTYDTQGRRIASCFPDQTTVSYTYQADRLFKITRKNQTYTYLERDLEGNPTTIELPAHLGTIRITRDPLGRWESFSSPFYTALFHFNAYDANNNLCYYYYSDPLGGVDATFSYDDLDQLILENEHTYSFDSLNNRIQKDTLAHTVNSLCQITDEGYTYDANGNMLTDGKHTFVYDTQDRLIEVKKENRSIRYTYDPFHRRLSKASFVNGKPTTHHERFLWDGQNEIGSIQEKKIQQLRILGEGLGAEIGAATFIEVDGITYIPIHDHRGNPTALIEAQTKEVKETYRFTAYGDAPQPRFPISPWRFAGKRYDIETQFLYFGRRYYNPSLGRWITPDPKGRHDGPNLYAYVHNNPLTHFDLYGLKAQPHNNQHQDSSQRSLGFISNFFSLLFPREFSTTDYRNGTKDSNFQVFVINGMGHNKQSADHNANYLSTTLGGVYIEPVYNLTQGPFDLPRAAGEVYAGKKSHATKDLQNAWKDYFEKASPKALIIQVCHSEGASCVKNGLLSSPEEIRQRIIVIAIAPAAYIPKELCLESFNYVSKRDIVPHFDFKGKMNCKDNTTILEPHKDAPLFDHSFQSPTYRQPIIDRFHEIYQRHVEKEE